MNVILQSYSTSLTSTIFHIFVVNNKIYIVIGFIFLLVLPLFWHITKHVSFLNNLY